MKTSLLCFATTLTFAGIFLPTAPLSAQNYAPSEYGRPMMRPDQGYAYRSHRGRDPLVAQVQAILVEKDLYHHVHHNQVDGIFGEETRHAVQDFQRLAGLPTTGMLDATTLQALGLMGDVNQEAAPITPSPARGAPSVPAPTGANGTSDVLTPSEVAEILKVTEADVVALLESSELEGRKIGENWRILRSAVDEFFRPAEVLKEEEEANGAKPEHKHDPKDGKHDHDH